MLTIAQEVLGQSFERLRRCGAGREECVVVWTGALERPGYADEVILPRHTASAVHYDIDPVWIGELWLDLAERKRAVRCQVHTHPGAAYHSSRDDSLALIHTPGYLSLVLPRFATGPVSLGGSYLTIRDETGAWHPLDPASTIEEQA
ncbi:MAG: hypothetical protein WEB06_19515 [Actinomycetota bacterium]